VFFAILGKQVSKLEIREVQKVSEGLFVFGACEAPKRASALLGDLCTVGLEEGFSESLDEGGAACMIEFCRLGRHFAIFHAVVDPDPCVAISSIFGIKRECGEVESALAGFGIVTIGANGLDRRAEARMHGKVSAGGQGSREEGEEEESVAGHV
jgi:hypothetical protein